MNKFDIAIIGLGPAGAVAARLLGRRYSVLAIDRKPPEPPPLTGGFSKPCGGLLAPGAQRALAAMGLNLPLDVLVDPQIFSVRTIDLQTKIARDYQRCYVNMDRDKFDRWLLSIALSEAGNSITLEAGAEFLSAEKAGGSREADSGFIVTYRTGGRGEKKAAVRCIVGADGAGSVVRRLFFPRFRVRSYTAIQEWFAPRGGAGELYACVFDPESTDSYAWALSKNSAFIVGGAFRHKHALASFKLLKQKLSQHGGFPLDAPRIRVETCRVLRPQPFRYCTGSGGVFLAGEAAGLISPSSLEGISYALESGRRLADVLTSAGRDAAFGSEKLHNVYRRAVFPLVVKLFVKNFRAPFMYWPPLRFLVMKSGITALRKHLPGSGSAN